MAEAHSDLIAAVSSLRRSGMVSPSPILPSAPRLLGGTYLPPAVAAGAAAGAPSAPSRSTGVVKLSLKSSKLRSG